MLRRELDIAFVPGGEMNTALALVAHRNGHQATLWIHSDKSYRHIAETGESPKERLAGIKLEGIKYTTDLGEAIEGKDLVFVTPKSKDLRQTVRDLAPLIGNKIVVCATKGFDEFGGKYLTPSEVVEQEIPGIEDKLAVLSGPNFAVQIALGKITGTTVAAYRIETAEAVRDALDSKNFWVDIYEGKPLKEDRSFDEDMSYKVRPIEIVGAFKNIVGLAIGFARSLPNYDENTGAFILKKGLEEAGVLCDAMEVDRQVLMELCGVGDYALLVNSITSRNVEAGENFGKKLWTLADLLDPERTIEGVRAARVIRQISRDKKVLMPITRAVYQVLYRGADPMRILETLLTTKPAKARALGAIARKGNGNGHHAKIEPSMVLA